jgi:hypothetical protein
MRLVFRLRRKSWAFPLRENVWLTVFFSNRAYSSRSTLALREFRLTTCALRRIVNRSIRLESDLGS